MLMSLIININNRIRARRINHKEHANSKNFNIMSPWERAKLEMQQIFKAAEKYRVGILKNITTFCKFG